MINMEKKLKGSLASYSDDVVGPIFDDALYDRDGFPFWSKLRYVSALSQTASKKELGCLYK